jgi:UDP-N-acetyl-2-amino-2-deoxyglucuronate dehydrogenase
MTQAPSKIAVIGLGSVAEPHLTAYRELPNVRVVGGADPRAERCAEISVRYGIPCYPSIAELLQETHPDIACVLTPASTHRAVTEECAAFGLNVLCEKPMAVTVEDAQAMASACERARVQFFYGSSYRFLPAIVQARQLILHGSIGDVRLIIEEGVGGAGAAAHQPLSEAHYPTGGPGGGGWGLVDHGIHMLDIFPWLCGSTIQTMCGRGDYSGGVPGPEYALMNLENGALGTLIYDGSTWPAELPAEGVYSEAPPWVDGRGWAGDPGHFDCHAGNIRVYGATGSLRIYYYANKLYLNQDGTVRECRVPSATAPHHFGRQLECFISDLNCGKSPASSASDGIRALRALWAIYRSDLARGHRTPVGP